MCIVFSKYFVNKIFYFLQQQQNSSVEGVFPPQRSTHPFRIIEHDAISMHSMTSLGRVGRILAGTLDVSNQSIDKDVINSTMNTANNSPSTPSSTSTTTTPSTSSNLPNLTTSTTTTNLAKMTASESSTIDAKTDFITEPQQSCSYPQNTIILQGKVIEQSEQEGRQPNTNMLCSHLSFFLNLLV